MSYQSIENVLSYLEVVEQTVSHKDNIKSLHAFLENIPDAVDEISFFKERPELKCFSNKIKLCSSQMSKILPPFVKLLSARTDPALKEIAHYLVEILHWCFSEILRIIQGGGLLDDSEPSGLFIKSVDNFTRFLNGEKIDGSFKELIEELLCHALTIAKITELEDYHEISAACRNVLTCTSGLLTVADVEKEPLKKDAILCSINILERKVNMAVLRLYLNVSSKFLPPLKKIIKKSSGQLYESVKCREAADIYHEVNVLDKYFERVQLIGNYAVACTECKKKKLKVQCSLTSLEFLANYIITAATSFYIDPTNLVKKRFLQFLTDESLDELKALSSHLDYNIVDTATFVQVTYEDIIDVIFTLKEKLHSGSYSPLDSNELISKCHKLVNHLKTTNDPLIKGNKNVSDIAKQLLNAVKDHGEQSRNPEVLLNKKLFFAKLDYITTKIEELLFCSNDQALSQTTSCNDSSFNHQYKNKDSRRNITAFTNCPKRFNNDNSVFKGPGNILTSTPVAVFTKKNASGCTTYKLIGSPTTPNTNVPSLDPYLSKISETPLLRSAVRVKTPYKEIYSKRALPKHLSFMISDAEYNGTLNHSLKEIVSVENITNKTS